MKNLPLRRTRDDDDDDDDDAIKNKIGWKSYCQGQKKIEVVLKKKDENR